MNLVVSGLEGCAMYLDDLVVFSDSYSSKTFECSSDTFDRGRTDGKPGKIWLCSGYNNLPWLSGGEW